MASGICESLIREVWRPYIDDDLGKAPQTEGIYAIGFKHPDGEVRYIYVEHTKDIQRRLQQHKLSDFPEFVRQQFLLDGGLDLRIKWKEDEDGRCEDKLVLDCMSNKLGYWPECNRQAGNRCE